MVGRRSRRRTGPAMLAAGTLLAGCGGVQSALDPRGPVAEDIATLWWVLLVGAALIYTATMGLLFYAVFRRHDCRVRLREGLLVVGGGLLFPTVTLVALLIYATDVGRRVVGLSDSPALQIEVTGHQWWWEVHYPATEEEPPVTTANELRLPLDVPVEVTLRSDDVIHSFWIPSLAGKLDAIPGRVSVIRFTAGVGGVYRGQCAEFCGAQHARMAFEVVAQSHDEFTAWRRARALDATLPDESRRAAAGRQAFMDHDCAECHRVGGAVAGSGKGDRLTGLRGPDLTHVARRSALGARTLQTARSTRGWRRRSARRSEALFMNAATSHCGGPVRGRPVQGRRKPWMVCAEPPGMGSRRPWTGLPLAGPPQHHRPYPLMNNARDPPTKHPHTLKHALLYNVAVAPTGRDPHG